MRRRGTVKIEASHRLYFKGLDYDTNVPTEKPIYRNITEKSAIILDEENAGEIGEDYEGEDEEEISHEPELISVEQEFDFDAFIARLVQELLVTLVY